MKLNKILSLTALVGALGISNVALADHDRNRDRASSGRRSYDLDVIGTARVTEGRDHVTFRVTPKMRRDGLQLFVDAPNLRILAVEFEYSDGRVVQLRGRNLRQAMPERALITIQQGRPPGLRFVHVYYAMGYSDRAGSLRLVQLHTGDGYTHEADLWENQDRRVYRRGEVRDRSFDDDDRYDDRY